MKGKTARSTADRPIRRPAIDREQRRVIRIFCEGAKTEPEYFDAVKQLVRRSAYVHVRSEPRAGRREELLNKAIAARNADPQDEVWCVFDVEARVDAPVSESAVTQLLNRATTASVNIAVSNPCFELWLALQLHRASLTPHDRRSRSTSKEVRRKHRQRGRRSEVRRKRSGGGATGGGARSQASTSWHVLSGRQSVEWCVPIAPRPWRRDSHQSGRYMIDQFDVLGPAPEINEKPAVDIRRATDRDSHHA